MSELSIEQRNLRTVEAHIPYLKHLKEWHEEFIEKRIIIMDTGSGNHSPDVEDILIEESKKLLKRFERRLKRLIKKYGSTMPYTLSLQPNP